MKTSFTRIAALARRFRQAEEGAVSILVAGMLVVLLGMTGLAVEVGLALFKRQQQQTVADAAAYSGALALANGESLTAIKGEAQATTAAGGYVNNANSVVVTVNSPPVVSVAQAGNASAVEVVIQQPLTMTLANLVNSWYGAGQINWTVQASSVATAGGGSIPCALQLSSGANPGVLMSGGTTVTLNQCGLQVCSMGNQALSMTGGAHLNLTDSSGNLSTAQTVSVAGSVSMYNNGSTINNFGSCVSPSCKPSQGPCDPNVDPYSGVVMPAISPLTCDQDNKHFCSGYGCTSYMPPGHYCHGPSLDYGNITMTHGTYFFDGGQSGNFTVASSVNLTCSDCTNGKGVTIVLTSSTGANYAKLTIGGAATVTLNAPTSGPMSGIAFFGDRNAPFSNMNNIQEGGTTNITGSLYFPSQQVTFSGGVSNPSGCTQLIAGGITFQSGANFSNNCASAGTSPIGGGGGATSLVE